MLHYKCVGSLGRIPHYFRKNKTEKQNSLAAMCTQMTLFARSKTPLKYKFKYRFNQILT